MRGSCSSLRTIIMPTKPTKQFENNYKDKVVCRPFFRFPIEATTTLLKATIGVCFKMVSVWGFKSNNGEKVSQKETFVKLIFPSWAFSLYYEMFTCSSAFLLFFVRRRSGEEKKLSIVTFLISPEVDFSTFCQWDTNLKLSSHVCL